MGVWKCLRSCLDDPLCRLMVFITIVVRRFKSRVYGKCFCFASVGSVRHLIFHSMLGYDCIVYPISVPHPTSLTHTQFIISCVIGWVGLIGLGLWYILGFLFGNDILYLHSRPCGKHNSTDHHSVVGVSICILWCDPTNNLFIVLPTVLLTQFSVPITSVQNSFPLQVTTL